MEGRTRAVGRARAPAGRKGVGRFGGTVSAAALRAMDEPVLVASTVGVGTKVELAARLGRYDGVGRASSPTLHTPPCWSRSRLPITSS